MEPRCIKILSFEVEVGGETFRDEWMPGSPSLHGVYACVLAAAHARCHDALVLAEHLNAERRGALVTPDVALIRAIDRRQRTAHAFAHACVRVFAVDAAEDLGAQDVARKVLLFTFRHGLREVARAFDELAFLSVGGHAELGADAFLARLPASPSRAGELKASVDRMRLRRIDEEKVADAVLARVAEAKDPGIAWNALMSAPIVTSRDVTIEIIEAEALAYADAHASVEADAEDASADELTAAAEIFDRLESEKKSKKRNAK